MELEGIVGSFQSFVHKRFIKDQTTRELVEEFLRKKPKYVEPVKENAETFFNSAYRAIQRKKKLQDKIYYN